MDHINARLDAWSSQIENAVELADETHNDQPSVSDWQQAINKLRSDIEGSL